MLHKLSRRDFLQVATSAGALGSVGWPSDVLALSQGPPAPRPAVASDGWFDRPMRWVQLTLVENDPGQFDPRFWIDYFRRLHADAATLSAAASSPTTRPRSRCTIAARGWPEAIRSARWSRAAARSGCA